MKKINNPQLNGLYLLCKEELQLTESAREKILYHATSPTNAISIANNNIDWRKTRRTRFGMGACFSSSPKYAHKYASSRGGN